MVDAEVTAEDQNQLTTLYTERAVQFIEKNKDRPFLLYLPHSMVHVPLHVSDKFRGKSQRGLVRRRGDGDRLVGRPDPRHAPQAQAASSDTLVIFTADNGPWLSYGDHAGSAGPLREGKGTMFDGGCRVPTLMWWPGTIPAGTVCRTPAMTIDILPTIAHLVGAKLPEPPDRRQEHLAADGRRAGGREPARGLLFLLGQAAAGGPHGPVEAALPARLPHAGGQPGRQGRRRRCRTNRPRSAWPCSIWSRTPARPPTWPTSIPTWWPRSRSWPTGCGPNWATRRPGQKGSGVREPGRLEPGDLRFDWQPGQPLQVEAP